MGISELIRTGGIYSFLIHELTPLAERPPILYKYLGKESARVFLDEPQLRYTKFTELDDVCDSVPAFTKLTEEESRRHAVERAQRQSDVPVSLAKRIKFFERLGLLPASYLEERLREELAKLTASTYICSLSAPNHSLVMVTVR